MYNLAERPVLWNFYHLRIIPREGIEVPVLVIITQKAAQNCYFQGGIYLFT